jgi:hypothetical protein
MEDSMKGVSDGLRVVRYGRPNKKLDQYVLYGERYIAKDGLGLVVKVKPGFTVRTDGPQGQMYVAKNERVKRTFNLVAADEEESKKISAFLLNLEQSKRLR